VPQAAQPSPPNTAPGASTNQSQSSGMLEEPQIVEVPPSSSSSNQNGVAIAPAPAQDNGTASNSPAKKPQAPAAPSATAATSAPKATSSATAANSKPGSAAVTPGDANTGYFLQVGAYKTASDAEQQRARLAFQGFESKVTQRDANGVTYYRVRIGPFAKFEDMNSSRQRLSDAGVDTAVIRFSKQ
jgi:cell division protein FtsN